MSELSGWYYDLQTDYTGPGRLTCLTLHPSTEESDDIDWPSRKNGDEDDTFYSSDPIAVALVNEDFQISIANTWSEFGGDPIGSLWESIRPLAPYAGYAEKCMDDAIRNYDDAKRSGLIKEGSLSEQIGSFVKEAYNEVKKATGGKGASSYLNAALVAMGTRFSYYSGTGINFGSMVMKYYILPKWEEGKKFTSVTEQAEKLFPYVVGHLMLNEKKTDDPDKLIAWQMAPGGFKSDYRHINTKQKGTLLLKYGGLYSVNNLVVEQANFVFSKQAVKQPNTSVGGHDQDYSPLFCEVTLQLKPASKFSDDKLKEFICNTKSLESTHANISGQIIMDVLS